MKKFRSLLVVLLFVCLAPYAQAADPYAHTNSKGNTYYLFSKDVQRKNSKTVQTIYYFAKDPKNKKGKPVEKVPDDRQVSETKNGLLVLKKKVKTEEPKKKKVPEKKE